MNIYIITELTLDGAAPIFQVYTNPTKALDGGTAIYRNTLIQRGVSGKSLRLYETTFRVALDKIGRYYCPHTENVYQLSEHTLPTDTTAAPLIVGRTS